MTPQMYAVAKDALEVAGVLILVVLAAAAAVAWALDRTFKGIDQERRR